MLKCAAMSQRIQLLPPSVAEKIAAGEVIERPASVVKELVENSLDAGATEVAVILEQGGKGLIEILDNGRGMGPDDLRLCVQRHATSKIRALEDLDRLHTLGFRGEALPSVAAVSEFSLLSRAEGATTAHELTPAGGPEPVTFGHFLGSPHGTRVRARGLFAQVPARLKFLKSQGAEVAQVREWLERLALTRPEVGFRLVSEDRTVLSLRPQDEAGRVRAILADGEDYPVITASNDLSAAAAGAWGVPTRGEIRVRAHWLQGLSSPQMRKLVHVVNRRAVKDRMLQQALLAPFRQSLLPGQFPAVALFIDVDPASLDVNVHPTKTEVRFLKGREVFRAVETLVAGMIAQHGATGYVSQGAGFASVERPDSAARPAFDPRHSPAQPSWSAAEPAPRPGADLFAPDEPASIPAPAGNPLRHGRFAGTLFRTYLMYELEGEVALVDQHAAHERIRYERLRARILSEDRGTGGSQALLIPEAARFPLERRADLEARLPWLERLGFQAELFGEDTLLFRGVPAEWGSRELRARLKSLVERTLAVDAPPAGRALLMDEALFERLASEACHSAVRAGDALEPAESETILDELFACEHPWNCPHGRPTVVRVPRARFEEWFQRRV
jgi:DNA mismatch repair protein MutL